MPSDLLEQLRQRAKTLPDGHPVMHETLAKLIGVNELTDGLMVLALSAVEAERALLTGKARKRVLARLLVDAMGSQMSSTFAKADAFGACLQRR